MNIVKEIKREYGEEIYRHAKEIQKIYSKWALKDIARFIREWENTVNRLRKTGADLSRIQLTGETGEQDDHHEEGETNGQIGSL